jgi:DNA-binding NarL/FixJ family response regulator
VREVCRAVVPVIGNRGVTAPANRLGAAPGRPVPRVVLADDDVLLREGLASLLDRSGFDVVGQAGNGVELLAQVRAARPELAVIDIRMPPGHGTEGLQAAPVIRAELPGTAIIVLSAHVEVEEAMELLAGRAGTGYLLKSRVTDVTEFIETVGRIAAAGSVVDPSLVQELIRARRRSDPLDVLSPRHLDQAGPARERHRAPPGTGRPEVPRNPLMLIRTALLLAGIPSFLVAGSRPGGWRRRHKPARPGKMDTMRREPSGFALNPAC